MRRATLAAITVLAMAAEAHADLLEEMLPQQVPGYDAALGITVQSRQHPEQAPDGVSLDDLVNLRPALDLSNGYDSGVNGGIARARPGSAVTVTQPSVTLGGDDGRSRAGVYASVTDTRYWDAPRQHRIDATAALGAVIAIGPGKLTVAAVHLNAHQDRFVIGALATDRPVAFRLDAARLAYALPLGAFTVTPQFDVSHYAFGDASVAGKRLSQSYRDRTVFQGGATVRYELAPGRALLLALRANASQYDSTPRGTPSENSVAGEALLGFDYTVDSLWRIQVLAGVGQRRYAAAFLGTQTVPIGRADVIWTPTGLTTVTLSLSRSMEDAAQEGVAGFTYTNAAVQVDHELWRDIVLQARAREQIAQYQHQGGTSQIASAGASAVWTVNRNLKLSLSYDHTDTSGKQQTPVPGLRIVATPPRDVALLTARFAL
jgi:hypothetical protein